MPERMSDWVLDLLARKKIPFSILLNLAVYAVSLRGEKYFQESLYVMFYDAFLSMQNCFQVPFLLKFRKWAQWRLFFFLVLPALLCFWEERLPQIALENMLTFNLGLYSMTKSNGVESYRRWFLLQFKHLKKHEGETGFSRRFHMARRRTYHSGVRLDFLFD